MFPSEIGIWRPFQAKNWCCSILSIFLIISTHWILLSGVSAIDSIPSLGVILNNLAGVQISTVKWIFLHRKEQGFLNLWDQLKVKETVLKIRSSSDPNIKMMRQSSYVQDMLVFLIAVFFGLFLVTFRFLQIFFYRPIESVYPTWVPFNSDFGTIGFWVLFFWQAICTYFNATCIATSDILIGSTYSQLILQFEVLNYDIEQFNNIKSVTPEEIMAKFRDFTKEFHLLQSFHKSLESFLKPLFFYHIITMMIAITFSCIETGVLLTVDINRAIPPFIYFLFLNISLFYWCWLGNRLKEKLSDIYCNFLSLIFL